MYRFTIRDVLWLTVVVALGSALALKQAQCTGMRADIEHQENRLFYADVTILMLAEEWNKDRPDSVEIGDEWVTINSDEARITFGRPLLPR